LTAPAPQVATAPQEPAAQGGRTLFGLSPTALHDRYWASRGVQVVRRAMATPLTSGAQLYLLLQQRTLCVFDLPPAVDQIVWADADLVLLRLLDSDEHAYRERIVADGDGRFVRIERLYGSDDSRFARAALTSRAELARLWQEADSPRQGWGRLRRATVRGHRRPMQARARVFDAASEAEAMRCMRLLIETWRKPDATIARALPHGGGWVDPTSELDPASRCIGPVWVGAGRRLGPGELAVGPDALWDDPASRPEPGDIRWLDIEPADRTRPLRPRRRARLDRVLKRGFDVAFAAGALAVTLPLYPAVMLAIWLEDGRPFFFAHRRESLDAREFPCLKFRSMRKDAESMKADLARLNQADGPQFYIERDPRLTRVGRVIRKLQIDELPQFLNVLVGHMSVVGPRPSPYKENQYCPGWREARLSVRPGVTGLWQVKRTRAAGSDFQEWIRYDIEYVETMSFWLDLWIIWKTMAIIARSIRRS